MSKRDQYQNNNFFEDDTPGELETAEDIQTELYGTRRAPVTKPTGRPVLVPIYTLEPDPAQPRRIVPGVVLDKTPANRAVALTIWREMANSALNQDIPVKDILRGKASDGWSDTDHAQSPTMARDYIELCNFAASCRDGLINPITYYITGNRSIIETGERRWTAHVLLHSVLGYKKYEDIRAVNMGEFDLMRQIKENAARAGLDAIGNARSVALALMHIYKNEHHWQFKQIDECSPAYAYHEYFAQAADLDVPRGTGGFMRETLNMTLSTISKYRKLLSLPPEIWQSGSDNHESLNSLLGYFDEIAGTNYQRTNADNMTNDDSAKYSHENTYDPPQAPPSHLTQAIDDAAFSDSDDDQTTQSKTASHGFFVGQRVTMIGRGSATVKQVTGDSIMINLDSTGSRLMVTPAHLNSLNENKPAESVNQDKPEHPDWAVNDPARRMLPLDADESVDPQAFADGRSGVNVDIFHALKMGEVVRTPSSRLAQVVGQGGDENFVTIKYQGSEATERFAVDYLEPVLTGQLIESSLEAHLLESIARHLANAIEDRQESEKLLRALEVLITSSPASLAAQDDIDILLTNADSILMSAFHHLRIGYQKQAHKITNAWREYREIYEEMI